MNFDPQPDKDDFGVPDWALYPIALFALLFCAVGSLIGLFVPDREEEDDRA